jgi:hypothetical protein
MEIDMETDVVKPVKAIPVVAGKGARVLFQSEAAEVSARKSPAIEDEVVSAAVIVDQVTLPVASVVEDLNEEVMVIPRQTVVRTRIGAKWYSFVNGRRCLVPRHVANLLEEKGIV